MGMQIVNHFLHTIPSFPIQKTYAAGGDSSRRRMAACQPSSNRWDQKARYRKLDEGIPSTGTPCPSAGNGLPRPRVRFPPERYRQYPPERRPPPHWTFPMTVTQAESAGARPITKLNRSQQNTLSASRSNASAPASTENPHSSAIRRTVIFFIQLPSDNRFSGQSRPPSLKVSGTFPSSSAIELARDFILSLSRNTQASGVL